MATLLGSYSNEEYVNEVLQNFTQIKAVVATDAGGAIFSDSDCPLAVGIDADGKATTATGDHLRIDWVAVGVNPNGKALLRDIGEVPLIPAPVPGYQHGLQRNESGLVTKVATYTAATGTTSTVVQAAGFVEHTARILPGMRDTTNNYAVIIV